MVMARPIRAVLVFAAIISCLLLFRSFRSVSVTPPPDSTPKGPKGHYKPGAEGPDPQLQGMLHVCLHHYISNIL